MKNTYRWKMDSILSEWDRLQSFFLFLYVIGRGNYVTRKLTLARIAKYRRRAPASYKTRDCNFLSRDASAHTSILFSSKR